MPKQAGLHNRSTLRIQGHMQTWHKQRSAKFYTSQPACLERNTVKHARGTKNTPRFKTVTLQARGLRRLQIELCILYKNKTCTAFHERRFESLQKKKKKKAVLNCLNCSRSTQLANVLTIFHKMQQQIKMEMSLAQKVEPKNASMFPF